MDFISVDAAGAALVAGVLAAFNPCGFALLPAYITVLVTGTSDSRVTKPEAIGRAISFGTAMTIGFVTVFIGFGLLFAGVNVALQGSILPYIAYITATLGILLVVLGIHLLRGGELNVPGLKIKGAAPKTSFASQIVYGAAFALASMSCTIAPFLAVVSGALDAPNPVAAATPFIVYGLGMGTSVLVVSLLAATAGTTAVAKIRQKMPVIMRVTSIVMIVVGVYVFVYGLAEILLANGVYALNGFLLANAEVQGDVVRAISALGPGLIAAIAAIVILGSIALWIWARRAARHAVPDAVDAGAPAKRKSTSTTAGIAAAGISLAAAPGETASAAKKPGAKAAPTAKPGATPDPKKK